ncbi:MAG TPA: neutral zinc metallopeptidase [Burkholderiaceae bacterium]|nr:neutral zinc metallopeptidase [Burkholderiaceae bacterium]
MRWEGGRESDNIEDRRGDGGGFGGFGGLGFGGRSIGIGTIVVALIGGWVLGINPLTLLGLLSGGSPVSIQAPVQSPPAHKPPADDTMARFVATVLADTEDTWRDVFRENGGQYREPKLVLFTGRTTTACGLGQAAAGPFYCPGDQRIYIDLRFYQQLRDRFRAPGDFAQAYVIAHEVGHHVQNLLGITDRLDRMRSRVSDTQFNAMSVRLELQADCFAGVWGHRSQANRNWLEAGDVDEALTAAAAIGDDTLQKQTQGYVVPESFTHGSSAQRKRWFMRGFESGRLDACNTFEAKSL